MSGTESAVDRAGLPFLEIGRPRDEARLSMILMHGLGADGRDLADVAAELVEAAGPRRWRILLPHAPWQPVTINGGMSMPAWYDILDMAHPRSVDWETVEASRRSIEALARDEADGPLVLAGFSQGAAMALHVGLRMPVESLPVAILSMSGYLLHGPGHPCPAGADIPIAFFHGRSDPVVPWQSAEESVRLLEERGHRPRLHGYAGLEHGLHAAEIRDVFAWLCEVGASIPEKDGPEAA